MNPRAARHSQAVQRFNRVARQRAQAEAQREQEAAEQQRLQAQQEFQQQLTESRLQLWILRDGDEATTMLAKLAVIIGTPCEAGARTVGREAPWVRQLHGALRSVQAMCLAGYHWNASFTPALDRAIELGVEHMNSLPSDVLFQAWVEANGFAALVLAHQVDEGAVAG